MRGKIIPVIAKKRIDGLFEIGDKLHVQSILHDKPKPLVNALGGLFDKDGKFLQLISCCKEIADKEIGVKVPYNSGNSYGASDDLYMAKMYEATFAPIGSYNYSVIILADGREFNDSVLGYRTLEYAFDKV